jgi:hypothetical protein
MSVPPELPMRKVNQCAARKALPGHHLPNMPTLAEQVLKNLVRLKLGCLRLMDLPPEELGALYPGNEARLGEAMGWVRHGATLAPARTDVTAGFLAGPSAVG